MDSRRDGLTPRTSMLGGSKPTVTPPRSMAGTTTPYTGSATYNNAAPSEFSDLDLALQQKLVSSGG